MADDEADFTLRLIDKITGPSRRAKRSLDKLASSARDVNRADRIRGRARDRGGRMRGPIGGAMGRSGAAMRGGGLGVGGLVAGNLVTEAVMQIGRLATSMARATGETIVFGQNARLAFDQLAKHGVAGSKLFEHARDLSRRFGLDIQDTTHSYQKFLALQFAPQEIDKLVKLGADLRLITKDADAVQGIFTAIGQIKSKNRLQAEEMLQLAERGVSQQLVWDQLALALGKTTQQIQQLQTAGKIKGDEAIAAIQRAVMFKLQESELGEAGKRFADTTIEGFIGRTKAFGQDAGITLVERLTEPLTKMAGRGFESFAGFLESPKGTETIDNISRALGRAGELAGVFFDSFGPSFMETFKELGSGAKELFGAFTGGDATTTENIVRALGRSFGEVTALTIGVAGGVAAVASGLVYLGHVGRAVGKAVARGIFEPIGTLVGKLLSWWDTLTAIWNDKGLGLVDLSLALGKHIIGGMIGGIENQIGALRDVVTGVARETVEAMRTVLGIHSPSREFMKLGAYSALGFAQGLEGGAGRIELAPNVFGPEIVMPRFDAATFAPAGGGGGNNNIRVTLNVDVHGGGNAAETAKLAARESRRELEAFFRQLALE